MSTFARPLRMHWVLAFFAGAVAHLDAQGTNVSEAEVRAVFLLRFTEFVEWPSSAFDESRTTACIGVFGEDRFGGFLDAAVRGELLQGRPIEVRRLDRIDGVATCQVLFVSSSEARRTREIVEALSGRNVLTVGESEGFARLGGMIEFRTSGGRTRLTINLDAAREADLTISSRLLRAAEIVGTSS